MDSCEPFSLEKINAIFSREIDDSPWDAFLESSPLGQFQQSSSWARVKEHEGWSVNRFALLGERGQIEGGLQLLWRRKGWLRIGYVSKGPVFTSDSSRFTELGPALVRASAQDCRIHAMIIQAPDYASRSSSFFSVPPFEENRLSSVISANLVIDLTPGIASIRKGISRRTRQKSRQALERGVSVREGSETDLDLFFSLMLATCARQREKRPNPSTVEQLKHIWRVFRKKYKIRLTLAICEGRTIAGLLSITFGSRVTFWKKGWNGQFADRHPNELLFTEGIEWAAAQGYRCCDFLGLNRNIAEALLCGRAISEEMKRSRDFFNLGFGGKPQLLPESRLYVSVPLLASLYGAGCRCHSKFKLFRARNPLFLNRVFR